MLLKLIICQVAPNNRYEFTKAQQQWDRMRGTEGLIGQFGGWGSSSNTAYIFGLWKDKQAYSCFMANVHDEIFIRNNQEKTYESISVSFYESEFSEGPFSLWEGNCSISIKENNKIVISQMKEKDKGPYIYLTHTSTDNAEEEILIELENEWEVVNNN